MSDLWECTLSPQQRDIHRLLSQGQSIKKAAKALDISVSSVKKQLSRIKQKQEKTGGDKNEIKSPLQYQSALLESPVDVPKSKAYVLIRELERLKGMILTPLQKEIILLKSEGMLIEDIAARLGITSMEVQAGIEQAAGEIERVQIGDGAEDRVGELIGGNQTLNQAQVLSCLSKGMSVKGTADRLGRSENSVRIIMHRMHASAKNLKEYKKNKPRFQTNHYNQPSAASLSLLRKYHSGTLTPKEKVEAEIILRSEGMIRSVPAIMKNNARLLNMFSAQKRGRVFHVTQADENILRQAHPGMNGSILDYTGASLLLVNRYAQEEDQDGTSFTRTYAVDHRFWTAIQMQSGSPLKSTCQDVCHSQIGETVGLGSRVLLQIVGTDETIHICLTGAQFNEAEEWHALSLRAPLAEALIGHKKGESVSLEVVKGTRVEYKILQIQNA